MKFQALLIKPTQKIYHKYSVNKSEIRKKILKIRKQSFSKSFNINIKYILRVLRKKFMEKLLVDIIHLIMR